MRAHPKVTSWDSNLGRIHHGYTSVSHDPSASQNKSQCPQAVVFPNFFLCALRSGRTEILVRQTPDSTRAASSLKKNAPRSWSSEVSLHSDKTSCSNQLADCEKRKTASSFYFTFEWISFCRLVRVLASPIFHLYS